MSRNPIYNGIAATAYITIITLLLNYTTTLQISEQNAQVIMPVIMLSLLTLSVAVMGYIFFYQPIRLYIEGKMEDGVRLFLQTVASFSGITALLLILYFSGVIS